ncbi:MAG TPA: Rieske (2Fe-2S) protein [Streptosporangiaceae bacterium]|nr:Rieske (2Fe-2S) protein [Streptosporangiaceae bacterium]
MTGPDAPTSSRRAVLAGAGAACVAALSGCTAYNANKGGLAGAPPAQNSPAASAGSSGTGVGNGNAPDVLASTSDVPVGGGKILTDKKIVITQPQAGTFDAFTAVCTHQGCIVTTVSGGTINCPCHGSKFSIANGSVVNGPATSPLAPVSIKVQGTSIIQA